MFKIWDCGHPEPADGLLMEDVRLNVEYSDEFCPDSYRDMNYECWAWEHEYIKNTRFNALSMPLSGRKVQGRETDNRKRLLFYN